MDQSENIVAIPIPPLDEDDELDLLEYIRSFLDQLYPALDLKVDDSDGRTAYAGHHVVHAFMEGVCLIVEYEVDTETYYGCKDMDSSDTENRWATGKSNGTHWLFPVIKHPEDRSTFEEF